MKRFKKMAVATLGVAVILGTSVFATVKADGTKVIGQMVNWTILNNGATISLPADQKPVIINNRAYLPVRALGEALGKDINWYNYDPNRVHITSSLEELQNIEAVVELNKSKLQIVEKDAKIKELETKVKSLEEDLKKASSSGTNLTTFENNLIKYYSNAKDYNYVRMSISVTEKTNKKFVVGITIDSRDYKEWDKLTNSKQTRLIEDIVYDVQKEYKYPTIDGYLNADSKASSYDFYTNSNDKLVYENRGGSNSSNRWDYTSLERDIKSRYSDVYSVSISEDSSYNIVAKVELQYAYDRYTSKEIDNLRSDIRYDIDWDVNTNTRYKIYVDFYYNGTLVNQDK